MLLNKKTANHHTLLQQRAYISLQPLKIDGNNDLLKHSHPSFHWAGPILKVIHSMTKKRDRKKIEKTEKTKNLKTKYDLKKTKYDPKDQKIGKKLEKIWLLLVKPLVISITYLIGIDLIDLKSLVILGKEIIEITSDFDHRSDWYWWNC